jgi:4-amino-4-deoxy-L-arabinose transferase-like glycosyltransferase
VLALLSRRLAIAALLTGLAVLTRSNAILLLVPLAIGAFVAFPERRVRHAAVFALLAVLAVAPWTIRNALAFHEFVPVSTEAGSAFVGTYNDVARESTTFPGAWLPPRQVTSLRGEIEPSDLDEAAEYKREIHAGLRYIGDHPGYFATELVRNSARLAGLGGRDWWVYTGQTVSLGPKRSDVAAYSFFVVLALAVAGVATRRARAPAWFWALPVVLWLSVIPFVGETRFRIPVEPFFLLLAAVALTRTPLPGWFAARLPGRAPAARASRRSP